MEPYEILTGVGALYRAPVGTAFPSLTASPAAPWVALGITEGGVTVTLNQTTVQIRSDQHTGPVKVVRTEENLLVETRLKTATLENLAVLQGNGVVDTAPGAGTIGTRELPLHRGSEIDEWSFLFRNARGSPYGDFPAQYELPRGYFDGPLAMAHVKGDATMPAVQFVALEDLTAAAESDRFGRLVVEDAAAT